MLRSVLGWFSPSWPSTTSPCLNYSTDTLYHAVTLTFDPFTLKVRGTSRVMWTKSVRKLSEIAQSPAKLLIILRIFTALHAMQTRYSDKKAVCPSLSVCPCLSVKRVDCDKTEDCYSICTLLSTCLKFLASFVPKIWKGSQNFKSRSREPFPTLFDLIFIFCCRNTSYWICTPDVKFLAWTVS